MICIFINPGDISDSLGTPTYKFVKAYSDKWERTLKDSKRSTLYATVSDRYREEILADVDAKYNLRKDAYSRAITGYLLEVSAVLTPHGRCPTCLAG
jgi:hypothetical protein